MKAVILVFWAFVLVGCTGTRDADRIVWPARGSYPVQIHVVSRYQMTIVARKLRTRYNAAGIAVWPKKTGDVAHIFVVPPFNYGLLAHELRHVFEGNFHAGRDVYRP